MTIHHANNVDEPWKRGLRVLTFGLAFATLGVLVFGQVPLTPGSKVAWDHDGLDINGNPENVQSFELAVTRHTVPPTPPDQAIRRATVAPANGTTTYDATTLFQGLPDGGYDVYARAVDTSGNVSEWTGPLFVLTDRVSPTPPSNLRLE